MKIIEMVECERCEGEGKTNMSCCGINIHGNDLDLCPDCGDHCGDESETCEDCKGSGEILLNNGSHFIPSIKEELQLTKFNRTK